MVQKKAAIAVLDTHLETKEAIKAFHATGFDMKKLSFIGKDYLTVEQVIGYKNTSDHMSYWGKQGALWGPLWGSTALIATLYSIGIPNDSITKFETAIKSGRFVLIVHGTADDVRQANDILTTVGHEVEIHHSKGSITKAPFAAQNF